MFAKEIDSSGQKLGCREIIIINGTDVMIYLIEGYVGFVTQIFEPIIVILFWDKVLIHENSARFQCLHQALKARFHDAFCRSRNLRCVQRGHFDLANNL